jgi:ABC-2 type transport system permease protein
VFERFARLWRYRELLGVLIRKELKVKYKNSVLGFAWSLLNPLLVLIVYWFAFGVILGNTMPRFPIFLLCGVLVWNFFSGGVQSGTTSVVMNAALVKKVSFPREVLPLASIGAACVHFVLQGIVLSAALFFFGHGVAWDYMILLPLAMLVMLVVSAGLAVMLSAINVHLRDMQHFLELLLIAWFWATPIVYPFEQAAGKLDNHGWAKVLYFANPILGVVLTFQRVLYNQLDHVVVAKDAKTHKVTVTVTHLLPHWSVGFFAVLLAVSLAVSVIFFFLSLYVFGRLEGSIAEEL